MREIGVYNGDEIREMENRNPLPDGQGKKYIVPVNMTPLDKLGETPAGAAPPGSATGAAAADAPPADDRGEKIAQTFRRLLTEAAARVVRKETLALRKAQPAKLAAVAEAFYADHGDYIRSAMMPLASAYAELAGADFEVARGAVEAMAATQVEEGRRMAAGLGVVDRDARLAGWEQGRAEAMADKLMVSFGS